MFVFDKRLSPEQAINHKMSSKAPFGFLTKLDIQNATAFTANIYAKDPAPAGGGGAAAGPAAAEATGTANAVALLTRVRWDLGATDPIILEGLIPIGLKQIITGMLYTGLTDIGIEFGVKVFEYDPIAAAGKKYYACFDASTTALKGKIQKSGDRELAIELDDNEDLSIQDNSFYPFSMKIVPYGMNQVITLASAAVAGITKLWGRTNPT